MTVRHRVCVNRTLLSWQETADPSMETQDYPDPVFIQPLLVFPTKITQKVAVWAHFPTLISKLSKTQGPHRNLIFWWMGTFGSDLEHACSSQISYHCSNSFSFFLVQSNSFSKASFSVIPTPSMQPSPGTATCSDLFLLKVRDQFRMCLLLIPQH